MMKILLAFLILTSASFTAFAQSESKCFQNEGLHGDNLVVFEIIGNEISGIYSVENGDADTAKAYEFTGTLTSNILRVKFDRVKFPDVAPSEMKTLNWTLVKTTGKEILRIKFYGKNYETNKYADYFADFELCEPNYDALLKVAKIVQFAKGKSSAAAPLDFKNASERKVFSINARQGQTLSIDAAGCKISVYLPGGKLYEFVEWESESGNEKTYASSAIDRLTLKAIPKTGNYLIVLGKLTEDAQPRTSLFKITN